MGRLDRGSAATRSRFESEGGEISDFSGTEGAVAAGELGRGGREKVKGADAGGGVGGRLAFGADGVSTTGGESAEGAAGSVVSTGDSLEGVVAPKLKEAVGAGADELVAAAKENLLEGAGAGADWPSRVLEDDLTWRFEEDLVLSSTGHGMAGGAGNISSSASSASWSSSSASEESISTTSIFFCFFSVAFDVAGEELEKGEDEEDFERFEVGSLRYSTGIVRSSCSRGEIAFSFGFSTAAGSALAATRGVLEVDVFDFFEVLLLASTRGFCSLS